MGWLERSEGWLEGSEGQPAGSEGQLEGSGGQPGGSEGQPERGRTYVRTYGISPHSTGLRPLLGPLPCYLLQLHHIRSRARVPLTS